MDPMDSPKKIRGLLWIFVVGGLAFLLAGGLRSIASWIPLRFERNIAESIPWVTNQECLPSPAAKSALAQIRNRLGPLGNDTEIVKVPQALKDPKGPKDKNQIRKSSEVQKLNDDDLIEFHVIQDPAINAHAFLGGKIYLNSGLLDFSHSPEELAAVLAHEMSHVQNRDVIQSIIGQLVLAWPLALAGFDGNLGRVTQSLMSLHFTRKQEEAADLGALRRLQRAEIDRAGFRDFFLRLEKEISSDQTPFSLLSDHPASGDRAQRSDDFKAGPVRPVLSKNEWSALKQYCRPSRSSKPQQTRK